MPQPIHLDHYGSTPLLPEVRQTIVQALEESANPSSIGQAGQRAKQHLERARKQVAALINAKPSEIYFTSCGTESNNWALRGLLAANKRKGHHLIISAIEHPSISLVVRRLEFDAGMRVSVLPVNHEGVVSPAALKEAMTPQTVLVSIMLANGEVGTIEPIQELAAVAHEHSALFHTDAIAAVGHAPVDVRALGVDALSLAANQFYGPQGVAALFLREGVRIFPLLEGGGQETGARSGTEALPVIVGMSAAAEIATQRLLERTTRRAALRDRLRDGLNARIEGLRLNGSWSSRPACAAPGISDGGAAGRLPHNLHVCIDGVSSESLVLGLDQVGIAAGLGSACNAKAMRPSHVLKAMGLTDEQAKGALVLSLGELTTDEEIVRAIEIIPQVVERLRRVTMLTMRN